MAVKRRKKYNQILSRGRGVINNALTEIIVISAYLGLCFGANRVV